MRFEKPLAVCLDGFLTQAEVEQRISDTFIALTNQARSPIPATTPTSSYSTPEQEAKDEPGPEPEPPGEDEPEDEIESDASTVIPETQPTITNYFRAKQHT